MKKIDAIKNRIIRTANKLGSSATTVKGAHRYIMEHQKEIALVGKTPTWAIRGRNKAAYINGRTQARLKKHTSIIPLGANSQFEINQTSYAENPRRKNWRDATATISGVVGSWTDEINCGRYSSRCTYTRYEYAPTVGSYGIIKGGLGLEYHYAGQVSYLNPPAGYRWDKDNNGIRIVSLKDKRIDYHPNSDDLRNYSKKAIRGIALDNFKVRQGIAQAAKQEEKRAKGAVAAADKDGAMICLRDSVKAGNCEFGTRAFAERHNLDPKRHYRPSELLKIANGDARRVALAVFAGLRRHRQEMSAGSCKLSDHR